MDLLEDPEIKETYDECKFTVKLWEHTFRKKYKRLPSRLDIKEASREVRLAYKTYFKLKSAALEQSFKDVEGFEDENSESFTQAEEEVTVKDSVENDCDAPKNVDISEKNGGQNEGNKSDDVLIEASVQIPDDKVWGAHLNNKKKEKAKQVKQEDKPNPNAKITKKLFCGSKFTKRNPRKSLSFSQKNKSDVHPEKTFSLSQPMPAESFTSFENDDTMSFSQSEHFLNSQSFQVRSAEDKVTSQPLNLIQSLLGNQLNKSLKSINTGWLERVAKDGGLPLELDGVISQTYESTKLDYDSDDIIEESDDESSCTGLKSLHIAKKRKVDEVPQRNENKVDQLSLFNSVTTEKNTEIEQEGDKNSVSERSVMNDLELHIESHTSASETTELSVVAKSVESVDKPLPESQPQTKKVPRTAEKGSKTLRSTSAKIGSIQTTEISVAANSGDSKDNALPESQAQTNRVQRSAKKSTRTSRSTSAKKGSIQTTESEATTLIESEDKPLPESRPQTKKVPRTAKKSTKTLRSTSAEEVTIPLKAIKKSKPVFSRKAVKAKEKPKSETETTEEQSEITPRRSSRQNKVKVSLEEISSGGEDPFASDTDEKDPEFDPENPTKQKLLDHHFEESEDDDVPLKTIAKKSRGKKPSKNEKAPQEDDEKEDKPYELEYSVKPRIVAPRYGSITKVFMNNKIATNNDPAPNNTKETPVIDDDCIKTKRQQAKEKLEKKISAGKLNDNFVRINIQKKVFVRGKRGRSFSHYKKSQWKSKKAKSLAGPDMDMRGCDGGQLTCFNCGQVGHFARSCKAGKGDGLLPLNAETEQEEDCPYPTLEEAARMAKDSALNVRKAKVVLQENGDADLAKPSGEVNLRAEDVDIFDDDIDTDLLLQTTLKLEEQVKRLNVQMYMDTTTVVRPIYELNEDGSVKATPPEVFETLRKFGHCSFRPGQERAVMRILSGKSTLVTLSTGSGKSLCYQLPAYMYSQREPCISLIISPLVSLMDDQVTGIAKFMKAACLHSNQTKTQRQKILEAISNGELSVLLVSPEAVVAGERQRGFGSFLRKLPPIAFACIDEAHCVSQWSHNFRPSYLLICRVLRESLGVRTVLGLTATATRATCESIVRHICVSDGDDGVISDIPLPDNLVLTVSKDRDRDHALLRLLISERFADCQSIIVYCTRRDECERVAGFIRTGLQGSAKPSNGQPTKKRKRVNLQAEVYHAGLSASRRRTIQNAFMSGELRIVVATVAFGMGINKSDIRAVIHFNMPSSFESYVQEVGRAGRDGLPAQCHVFLDCRGHDENELRRHIHANSIDRHVIRKLLQKVFVPCSCAAACPKHEVAFSIEETVRTLDIPEENIATLLCYLELHPNKYIELLSPGYTSCKVISYGGAMQIRKAAKDCPPLAMALALHKRKTGDDANVLEYPVVEVASAMGWESGICKHKLKNLEWTTVNNQPKRSPISVQFSNLGFRLFAPGNLSGDQLDEALDNLYNRVVEQEQTALRQLHAVHTTLTEAAKPAFDACVAGDGGVFLKTKVRQYFDSSDPFRLYPQLEQRPVNEEQLVSDIRALVCMYRDNSFTGRAVARIFHGIQSPNYPAVIWGRCKFWRSHLHGDFQTIVKIATREIIKMR